MGNVSPAILEFERLASQERFQGYGFPLVGEPELFVDIPWYGEVWKEIRREPDDPTHAWYPIVRKFGWAVALCVTKDGYVPTLCQRKNGVGVSWELPPGGVRAFNDLVNPTEDDYLAAVQAAYLKETGFGGGKWQSLGHVTIESGKYRGPTMDSHGLKARLYLATDIEPVAEARSPGSNEVMETIMVPVADFYEVLESRRFNECSAVSCAYKALRVLGL
ncbi:MAG: hypothetical protein WCV68_02135 [Candidatus Paceibacterota bacterium]